MEILNNPIDYKKYYILVLLYYMALRFFSANSGVPSYPKVLFIILLFIYLFAHIKQIRDVIRSKLHVRKSSSNICTVVLQ